MLVQVTREDILHGRPDNGMVNPVARAIRRSFLNHKHQHVVIEVGERSIFFMDPVTQRTWIVNTPKDASEFLASYYHHYDIQERLYNHCSSVSYMMLNSGHEFVPFSFELNSDPN